MNKEVIIKKIEKELVENKNIKNISLWSEIREAFTEYAFRVIEARALPNSIDGLKPVQRRILYSMWVNSTIKDRERTKKSVNIVGQVMGVYHPHGDSSIYQALVRMAQSFVMSGRLVIGKGNFGSIDGDPAASFRYTEVKLSKLSHGLLSDLEYDVVDKIPNFDNTCFEPVMLPAKFPQLLVNGASGIAVGMATNCPPHNIHAVNNCCRAYVKNPDITAEELADILLAPDFPTGGEILYDSSIRNIYTKGKGAFTIRAKALVSANTIIFTDVPYQTNKSHIVMRISDLIEEKALPGVSHVIDESDLSKGIRIVVYLKKDSYPEMLLNKLYSSTDLQIRYNAHMLALVNSVPTVLDLRTIIENFINFRNGIIITRYSHELSAKRERLHGLIGTIVARDNFEPIIKIITEGTNKPDIIEKLKSKTWVSSSIINFSQKEFDTEIDYYNYSLSTKQCNVILDMRLQDFGRLENAELINRMNNMMKEIQYYSNVISLEDERKKIILQELTQIDNLKELNQEYEYDNDVIVEEEQQTDEIKFTIPQRRTNIIYNYSDINISELIPNDSFIMLVDKKNHIKKMPLSDYKVQHRGGLGKMAMENITSCFSVGNALDNILLFSNMGRVYNTPCYKIPTMGSNAQGSSLKNLIVLGDEQDEFIHNISNKNSNSLHKDSVIFVTTNGLVKRNDMSLFANIRKSGKRAIILRPKDSLVKVLWASEEDKIVIITGKGKAMRFELNKVTKVASGNSKGVRGIRLGKNDTVVDACIAENDSHIITVSKKGMCKITEVSLYRETNRGTKGVIAMKLSPEDIIVSAFSISKLEGEIITITTQGQIVRSKIGEIRSTQRNTKGVILVKFKNTDDSVLYSMSSDVEDKIGINLENADSE